MNKKVGIRRKNTKTWFELMSTLDLQMYSFMDEKLLLLVTLNHGEIKRLADLFNTYLEEHK